MAEKEVTKPLYTPKTEEELRTLARDIMARTIVGTWDIPEDDHLTFRMVFMPLMLMTQAQLNELKGAGIVHLYGHLRDNMGRGINGYPILHTIGYLDRTDADRLHDKLEKLRKVLEDL